MDQNFSLMAQSRANYYTAGSPVQFVRVELLKGDVTGEVAVCLTFKNVGTEPLTGFIIHFKCKDASGQILCEDDFYYEQLNVQPGELFGADDAVFVSDTPVSSVEIEQDRAFLNGRGVDLRNYKRVRLQAPRVLPGSIARTLQTRTNNKMLTCVPQDTENGWFCACGAFHPNEEAVSVCSECGGDRAYIKATLTRILEEARQTAEQQQREINAVANGVDPAAAQAAQAAATAAAAIEHFHSAALIHDDIADEAELRRGEPCLHLTEGLGLAINMGDLALSMVNGPVVNDPLLEDAVKVRVIKELIAMTCRTVEGQALDLGWARDGRYDITPEDYLTMAIHKTAHYSGAVPLAVGAIVGGADDEIVEALRSYGLDTGLAFQIQDDLLNLVGTDEAKKKDFLSLIHI